MGMRAISTRSIAGIAANGAVTVRVGDAKKFVLLDGSHSTLANGALPVIKTLDWLSRKDIFDEHQRQRFLR
jgi:hypothetical protein